jgi:hypothetical protein
VFFQKTKNFLFFSKEILFGEENKNLKMEKEKKIILDKLYIISEKK